MLDLLLAFAVAFATMFIGAISGGVGLVLRPLLIFLGFPAVAVVASVRVAAVPGDLPGILLLHRHGKVDWKLVWFLVVPMFLGSLVAGLAVLSVLRGVLEQVMGAVMLAAGLFLALHRKAGKPGRELNPRWLRDAAGFVGTTAVSFLATTTGGMVPLFTAFYIFNYRKGYIEAASLAKVALYLGAGLASAVFIAGNAVDWGLCLACALGLALGSFFGTRYGLRKGEEWMRTLVLLVIFASALKLIFFP